MSYQDYETEAGVAATIASELQAPEISKVSSPKPGEAAILTHGPGVEVTYLDQGVFQPERVVGEAKLTTLQSFVDLANRHKGSSTAVFADDDRESPKLVVAFDYHGNGTHEARFADHQASYSFPLSEEWEFWTKNDGRAFDMVEFAQLLEDRIIDIDFVASDDVPEQLAEFVSKLGGADRIATPQQLVDIAANLSINEASRFKKAHKLSSGEAQIEFETEHETRVNGLAVTIPSMFLLAIPVFRRGNYYRILARLRYRKEGGSVVFFYELVRPDRSIDHAIYEATEKVKAETELPVFFGTPEA